MPEGADAVVMVERTTMLDDDRVEIEVAVPQGNHVRPAGEDFAPGDSVFNAGEQLRPGHLGVLASAGITDVDVVRRARVGVLSTGDELVDGDGPLAPGQIRDANRHALLALAREAGCDAVDLGIARDDESSVRSAIEGGLGSCDVLLTSGGVSMGDYDFVKAVLGETSWMQVAIRPAKPLSYAIVDGKPVFGLPGNPASSMVSFELFARPALLAMMGRAETERPRVRAIADEGFRRSPDGRLHLVRVVLTRGEDGELHAGSAGGQGSNLLTSMARADGFALVPDGNGIDAGGAVEVLLLR
jgi:molybdenum cofactor synthesis domain-containing protein